MRQVWNQERYDKWEEEVHIPQDIMAIVDAVCEKIGIVVEETVVSYINRGGWRYAVAKGFEITHCTSSLADGPSEDMAPAFIKWLGGLGFEVCRSYGDNGLDSATNWHDTFWTKEIAYKPTMVGDEKFYDWVEGDSDTEDDYEDEEDWY